ncbi:MAG: 50S ribosomal protein L29 [Alphaproteobacteria bacterium MarineAlpha5_Bin11]|nr:50S ribosomal protein L29 [Pelagibacteraceae bacterium]PPR43494.1 MAG: 50S ribosomal protein L29 [Alphaproteobacteria bacterium MarineAlpha5_Bin11]PPR51762.1 MAG: 50S ribosomal protein L29 [Alphaproteobacteria bacterium MarineAlpha5_Bin10]|tara:strand:- start:311 stop:511 length:201 start_codon:yes stop_codon:yes gene_type:complete
MAKKKNTNLSIQEIKSKLSDLKKEMLNFRFKKSSGQLENTSQIKKTRRLIASMNTKLSQKQGGDNA